MDHMDYVNHMKVGGGDGDLGYYGDGDGDSGCDGDDMDHMAHVGVELDRFLPLYHHLFRP